MLCVDKNVETLVLDQAKGVFSPIYCLLILWWKGSKEGVEGFFQVPAVNDCLKCFQIIKQP